MILHSFSISFALLLTVFVQAYNRFGVQKERYRSQYPGTTVPFSLFDFL